MESLIPLLIGIIVLLIVLGAIGFVLQQKALTGKQNDTDDTTSSSDDYPYCKKQYILSPAEYSFYKALLLQLPDDRIVMAKMRLADIIDIEKGLEKSRRSSAWNRIKSKHVDFVILDKKTCTVQSIIELDDTSHQKASAQKNDEFKNKACAAVGISLHRITAKRGYTTEDLDPLVHLVHPNS